MKQISVSIRGSIRLGKLVDSNGYLQQVLISKDGGWYINRDDTSEVERILKKNRIKYKIK